MKPERMHIPGDIQELLVLLGSMLMSAPKFEDRTGWLPFLNLEYVFKQLDEGLARNRSTLGEGRYRELQRMSGEMRALFVADPDDTTGDTLRGCKIIHMMEDILRESRRKAQRPD